MMTWLTWRGQLPRDMHANESLITALPNAAPREGTERAASAGRSHALQGPSALWVRPHDDPGGQALGR